MIGAGHYFHQLSSLLNRERSDMKGTSHLPRDHRLRKLPQEELEGAGEGVHVLDGGQDLEVALRSDF